MTLPMELSIHSAPDSDTLSLDGVMPLSGSEYNRQRDVFFEPSTSTSFRSVFVFKEPPRANSDSDASDSTIAQGQSSPFADKVKKWWAKIWSLKIDNIDGLAMNAAKSRAALRFQEGLRVIDNAHDFQRISFGIQVPRAEFPLECFSALDEALCEEMAASLVVEGGDEDQGLQEDYINISVDIHTNSDRSRVTCITVEEVD
ncbi:hypothetical protein TWF481_011647 [Arthrobotrys musiformis]|uniref:Uncharacterized protein n=1 Tax=Arthrobotrys musiformis TaxID=47236 RepID=A0AAV9W0T8_9PEZI